MAGRLSCPAGLSLLWAHTRSRFPRKRPSWRVGKPVMFPLAKLLGALSLAFALTVSTAQAYTGQNLAKQAKLSIADARAIALKAQPGHITSEELKKEVGGSNLRYSFDIENGTTTYEVGIDAQTGAILANAPEGKKPD
jgi:hypothetical protein